MRDNPLPRAFDGLGHLAEPDGHVIVFAVELGKRDSHFIALTPKLGRRV